MFREISEYAVPEGLFDAYPPARDRKRWEAIPEEYRRQLIGEGEKWLGHPWSPIYATEFMEFCRTGNRSRYEEKLFLRRTALDALVLGECAEYQGRFLDDIINVLFLICEETAWQLPAHNTYIRDTPCHILPDVTRPVVDLFAAETGAVAAMAEYLLRDRLEEVSPAISRLVNHHLETRVLTPYRKEHFWWMGDGVSPMNNWTSWCTQNVLLTAFTRTLPQDVGTAIVKKACRSLDYFLDEYGEDGCCDEGAQYYRHAGLTLFNSMEILNRVCGGRFASLYENPKIRNIAAYIAKVHVDGPYYVNFADCSPLAGRCGAREYLFGKRTGNQELMAFAAEDYRACEDRLFLQEHNLLYRVQGAFCHEEMMEYRRKGEETAETGEKNGEGKGKACFFPSTGLFIARDQTFCLAVKAGDNNDSHNHNDTGSFTVYRHGQPLFIDVGVESYTKKTFSPQRYEIWTMQSQYHNLPAFGGVMEKDGAEFRAESVEYDPGEGRSRISMELAKAYPACGIESYVREAYLEYGKEIRIRDQWRGEREPEDVVLSLMTCEKPELISEGQGLRMIVGSLGSCLIRGQRQARTEEIPVTDPRLQTAWKHSIYRTLVTFGGTWLELVIPAEP